VRRIHPRILVTGALAGSVIPVVMATGTVLAEDENPVAKLQGTLDTFMFFTFQVAFAATAATIVSGARAERTRFTSTAHRAVRPRCSA
jgi:ammonia channel protein AmtB